MSNEADNKDGGSKGPEVEVKRSLKGAKKVRYQGQELEVLEEHAEGLRLPGYCGFVAREACVPVD